MCLTIKKIGHNVNELLFTEYNILLNIPAQHSPSKVEQLLIFIFPVS